MIVGANQFRLELAKPVVSSFQTGMILAGISFLTSKTAPLYAHLAPSRHCKTILIGSTPDGPPPASSTAGIARSCGLFLQYFSSPAPVVPRTCQHAEREQGTTGGYVA